MDSSSGMLTQTQNGVGWMEWEGERAEWKIADLSYLYWQDETHKRAWMQFSLITQCLSKMTLIVKWCKMAECLPDPKKKKSCTCVASWHWLVWFLFWFGELKPMEQSYPSAIERILLPRSHVFQQVQEYRLWSWETLTLTVVMQTTLNILD